MKTQGKNSFKQIFRIQEMSIIITLIILVAITGIIKPNFFMGNNLLSILRYMAFIGIICVGESICLLLGEFDISMGQLAGLGAIITTWMMTSGGLPPIIALFVSIIGCAILGFVNGFFVAKVGLSAFITTIGMTYVAKGLKYIISKGYPIYPLPDAVSNFGLATPLGLSWAIIISIILYIVFGFILAKTTYGRKIYAVGDNKEVAKIAGINIVAIKISGFIISGIVSCLAGSLLAFQINTGQATIGEGWELQAVAAASVGGISLAGGKGTMLGMVIGVLLISVLNNSLVLLKIDSNVQTVVIGIVLLAAVTLDIYRNNRKMRSN
jgi:ribose transport system permease protein